jgi:hypothetical protein
LLTERLKGHEQQYWEYAVFATIERNQRPEVVSLDARKRWARRGVPRHPARTQPGHRPEG